MHVNIISLCPVRGTELGGWPMEDQSAALMEFILLGFPLSRQVEDSENIRLKGRWRLTPYIPLLKQPQSGRTQG